MPALDRAWTTDEASDVTAALASGELVRVLCLDEMRNPPINPKGTP